MALGLPRVDRAMAHALRSIHIPFGLRAFFRLVFLTLAGVMVALALTILLEEKQRAYEAYATALTRSHAQLVTRLRHPSGQLALLNPTMLAPARAGVRPLVLPFGALDFDDRFKAFQAIETAGCLSQYSDATALCVAVGNRQSAGAFIYIIGSFNSAPLVPLAPMNFAFELAHHMRISVEGDGVREDWIAPFQMLLDGTSVDPARPGLKGRLTGYDAESGLDHGIKPRRDFRAWVWQDSGCPDANPCLVPTQFSIRVPVQAWIDAGLNRPPGIWPPSGISETKVRVRWFAPGSEQPTFDSSGVSAVAPLSAEELRDVLQAGEELLVRSVGKDQAAVFSLRGQLEELAAPAWLERLVTRLPLLAVERFGSQVPVGSEMERSDTVKTSLGSFEVRLVGNPRLVDGRLAKVTQRVSWMLWGSLLAIGLAWLALELRMMQRITALTRRAALVRHQLHIGPSNSGSGLADGVRPSRAGKGLHSKALADAGFGDLAGRDELGTLAKALNDLVQQVDDQVQKEQTRLDQEKDTWQAVGHEIMSPLHSLLVLHPEGSGSHRYLKRMQQAVQVLYGKASPADAIRAVTPELAQVEMAEFLRAVAANAIAIGVDQVQYIGTGQVTWVSADEHWLEDVMSHLLNNAARHRTPGTSIDIDLQREGRMAVIKVGNQGAPIDSGISQRLFEYGVSTQSADSNEHRGQGLFVVKTYVNKMGGTVTASSSPQGVIFELRLGLVAQVSG